jgi:hypothetical protein
MALTEMSTNGGGAEGIESLWPSWSVVTTQNAGKSYSKGLPGRRATFAVRPQPKP